MSRKSGHLLTKQSGKLEKSVSTINIAKTQSLGKFLKRPWQRSRGGVHLEIMRPDNTLSSDTNSTSMIKMKMISKETMSKG